MKFENRKELYAFAKMQCKGESGEFPTEAEFTAAAEELFPGLQNCVVIEADAWPEFVGQVIAKAIYDRDTTPEPATPDWKTAIFEAFKEYADNALGLADEGDIDAAYEAAYEAACKSEAMIDLMKQLGIMEECPYIKKISLSQRVGRCSHCPPF